jgi:hypothetical protein
VRPAVRAAVQDLARARQLDPDNITIRKSFEGLRGLASTVGVRVPGRRKDARGGKLTWGRTLFWIFLIIVGSWLFFSCLSQMF